LRECLVCALVMRLAPVGSRGRFEYTVWRGAKWKTFRLVPACGSRPFGKPPQELIDVRR